MRARDIVEGRNCAAGRRRWCRGGRRLCYTLSLILGLAHSALGAPADFPDYTVLSLEELMDLPITSVAKKVQKWSDAAAAVFVMTREDIQRSGVTSLPEALRLAPGVDVARLDANKWAIAIRGLNRLFTDKLLVLMDGRSVYTPLFAGVYWDVQDPLLEDIERIEVIRGPGAALWGANAVNGVINIITKHAKETQGGLVTAGAGTEEWAFGSVRYGVQLGTAAYVRAYAKSTHRDDLQDEAGTAMPNGWHMHRGGVRLDWQPSAPHAWMVQGDLYGGALHEQRLVSLLHSPFQQRQDNPTDLFGGHALLRWHYTFADASLSTVQLSYDRTERQSVFIAERRDTVDLDAQYQYTLGDRPALVMGLGYRWTQDDTRGSSPIAFVPDARSTQLWSACVQDDIALVPARLRLTLGARFEHHDATGWEVQPNARLLWTPQTQHYGVGRAITCRTRSGACGRRLSAAHRHHTAWGVWQSRAAAAGLHYCRQSGHTFRIGARV